MALIYPTLLVHPCIFVSLILAERNLYFPKVKVRNDITFHGDGCREALWLPYRKDRAQLKEAIEAAGPVKAVFAHADVVCHAPTYLRNSSSSNTSLPKAD